MFIDFGVTWLLKEKEKMHKYAANSLGFMLAASNNYIWNRLWTFPESRRRPIGNQLFQFILINVMGLGINELVVLGLHPVFAAVLPDPPAYIAAKIIAIGIVLFWNYFVNRKWTYKGID